MSNGHLLQAASLRSSCLNLHDSFDWLYMYLYDSMSNGKGLGRSTSSLGSFWPMLKKGANNAQHQFLKTTNQNLLKWCSLRSSKLQSSPKILETGTWLLIALCRHPFSVGRKWNRRHLHSGYESLNIQCLCAFPVQSMFVYKALIFKRTVDKSIPI